ncbi:hypothetical protein [Marinobacter sp. SS13-12]|uniref:hypothetical protein n=1 Tax=Marinobacter sp. SS13-12 TaxID=3050451 RepID=UPI0025579B65|nr:hypothetical protein [Marinobacter sp. SS13-12]MDK8463821.1 hypothetical protein [Marinobacter sp. SS13-12]
MAEQLRESASGRFFTMWILNNAYFQVLIASLLTVAVYALGFSGGFYFDDEWNILRNQALQLDSLAFEGLWNAALSGTAGPLGRPISVLSFALNHVFFGLDPFYFKLVNLTIHVFCGWVIYALALALSEHLPKMPVQRRHLFAFLVMLLWLLHPLNLSTVLYPVQRMASLSALFCLLGMFAYVKARHVSRAGWGARAGLYALSFLVFWPLAMYSKENALLFPIYLFLIELVFLKFQNPAEGKTSRVIVLSYGVLFVLPGVLLSLYLVFFFPDWILNGYANRDFSLGERLLTQSRVIAFYLGQVFLPINSSLGLFHDDFALSTSLLSPWTTVVAVLFVFVAVVAAFSGIRKYPVIAFGVLFFLAAHSMESTIFSLELVHEHRNYLAIFSVLFAIAYYLVIGSDKFSSLRVLLAGSLIIFFGLTTLTRAAVWGEPVVHVITEVSNHPLSPRANYGLGKQYAIYANALDGSAQKTEAIQSAVKYFEKSAELRASYVDGLFGLLMLEGLEGHQMSEESYRSLLRRLRIAPFSNNTYNYLHGVLSCLEAGDCEISNRKMNEIFDACRDNPGFSGKHARNVQERYQRYRK